MRLIDAKLPWRIQGPFVFVWEQLIVVNANRSWIELTGTIECLLSFYYKVAVTRECLNETTLQRCNEDVSAFLNRHWQNPNFPWDKITSSCVLSFFLPSVPLTLVNGTISSTFFPVAFFKIDTENDSSRSYILPLLSFAIPTSSSPSLTEVFPFYMGKLGRAVIVCKYNFVAKYK